MNTILKIASLKLFSPEKLHEEEKEKFDFRKKNFPISVKSLHKSFKVHLVHPEVDEL